MTHSGVRLETIDWDKEAAYDLITGRGFEVTEPAIKGKDQKSEFGIQSPLFCSDWSDENAFAERYSCECGEMRGKVFEGEICPSCKSVIKFKDVDLGITGWIILKKNYIIHPIYFNKLSSAIGAKKFMEIIEFGKKVTKDGALELEVTPSSKYAGIGLIEFKERFFEIMSYYAKRNKKKADLFDEIMANKSKVFAHSIPVYSSVLRPTSFRGDSFFYSTIDKKYNSIFSSVRLLNDVTLFEQRKKKSRDKDRMTVPAILGSIQVKLMKLYSLIFEQIDQKDGHIKSEILGGMINFSSRNVIVIDPTLKADEVILNYTAFLELFKYEIIAMLTSISDITEHSAYEQWFKARIKYSPKMYELMCHILEKNKPRVLINRNPTLNYGSLLSMKIKGIKNQYAEDFTMSLPPQILKVLNADFDGDILNVISLKTNVLMKAYDKVFNPRKNMYVSHNDGLFNADFNLFKDQLIGLYEFNNIA